MVRFWLSDDQFKRIEAMLPGKLHDPGRTATDNRFFVEAKLWIARTGSPWRDPPGECSLWNSSYQRFARCSRRVVWHHIFAHLAKDSDFEEAFIDSTIVRARLFCKYRCKNRLFLQIALELTGGNPPRPGEISLAHQGVLFLDELPEFDRKVLETLREPLESGRVHIARAARHAEFPAEFQLIAAMNPCPCGYQGHSNGKCRCTPDQVARYRSKLSGPFLDRIDLLIEVPALPAEALHGKADGESSATVRTRVSAALDCQLARQGKPNARLSPGEIDTFCVPDAAGSQLLKQAMSRLQLSARAWHRILKVARSIADLAGSTGIHSPHIAEAIQYRRQAHD